MHKIYTGEATIIISKQKFSEIASKCVVDSMPMVMTINPALFAKLFAVYLSHLTYALFDEDGEE